MSGPAAGYNRSAVVTAALLVVAVLAGALPAFAAAPGAEVAMQADSVVARLRDLPLPLKAFPSGIASKQATARPMPALERRRQRVYEDLHLLGAAGVAALARALRDPDVEMRRDVLVALDVIGGGWWQFPDRGSRADLRPALPALLAALQDSDSGVRAWAAQDISDLGAAAATAVRAAAKSRSRVAGQRLHRPGTHWTAGARRAAGLATRPE